MSNYTSILMIPAIMFIAGVSVVFISKIGGKAASKEYPAYERQYGR